MKRTAIEVGKPLKFKIFKELAYSHALSMTEIGERVYYLEARENLNTFDYYTIITDSGKITEITDIWSRKYPKIYYESGYGVCNHQDSPT